jgi:hypothetical protein
MNIQQQKYELFPVKRDGSLQSSTKRPKNIPANVVLTDQRQLAPGQAPQPPNMAPFRPANNGVEENVGLAAKGTCVWGTGLAGQPGGPPSQMRRQIQK